MEKFVTEIAKALESISKSLHGLSKKVGRAGKPTAAPKATARDRKPGRGAAPKMAVAATRASKTIPDQVLEAIKPARKGINIEGIQGKTGLSAQQVNNALAKLLKAGSVSRVGRGVYTAAGGVDASGGKQAAKAAPKAKAKAPLKGPKPKAKASAPAADAPKAKVKAEKKAAKPMPKAAGKTAQTAPKAPRKPRRAKVSESVVEQPPVVQEPQALAQDHAPADVLDNTQPTSTETVE